MYAIIKTGGKQYKVAEGDVIMVEKLSAAEGEAVVFDEVLTVVNDGDVKVGKPVVEGAKVTYLSMGFDGYLSKPVLSRELEEMLMKFLPKDKIHT